MRASPRFLALSLALAATAGATLWLGIRAMASMIAERSVAERADSWTRPEQLRVRVRLACGAVLRPDALRDDPRLEEFRAASIPGLLRSTSA